MSRKWWIALAIALAHVWTPPAFATVSVDLVGAQRIKLGPTSGAVAMTRSYGLLTMRDPRCPNESRLEIRGSGGQVRTVDLPCNLWTFSGRGYKYVDPSGSAGGVAKIVWKSQKLKIKLRGGAYAPLSTPVSFVEVRLTVHRKSYCARFLGFTVNSAGAVVGRGAIACDPLPTETPTVTVPPGATPTLTPSIGATPTRTFTLPPGVPTYTRTRTPTPTPLIWPEIHLTSPAHGIFIDPASQTSVSVTGTVSMIHPGQVVTVNGVAVTPAPNGSFSTTVNLDAAAIFNPIRAQVTVPGSIVSATDRRVVIYGKSIAVGGLAPQSVGLRLTDGAFAKIVPAVSSLLAVDPSAFVQTGTNVNGAVLQDVGMDSFAVNLDSRPGLVHADIVLNGFHVSAVHSDTNCTINIRSNATHIIGDYALEPKASDPSHIDVTQVGVVSVVFDNFNYGYQCDGAFGPIIELFIPLFIGDLQSQVRSGFEDTLNAVDANGNTPIAGAIEQALAGVSIADQIGGATGTSMEAPMFKVEEDANGITIGAHSSFTANIGSPQCQPPAGAPTFSATLHVPDGFPSFGATVANPDNPAQQLPYHLAMAISASALNQMLRAQTECGLMSMDLSEIDLGTGSVQVTAGLLSGMIPEFASLDPSLPLTMRLRPTIAPIITGNSGPGGEPAELRLSQLILDIFDPANPGAGSYLRGSIDLRSGLNMAFDAYTGGLSFALSAPGPSDISVSVLENKIGTDPTVVEALVPGLFGQLMPSLAGGLGSFPLPAFFGYELRVLSVVKQGTFLVLYANLATAEELRKPLIAASPPGSVRNDYTGILGTVFLTGPAPITIHELGFYDHNGDGLATSHRVGVWRGTQVGAGTGTLIAEATVEAGTASSLEGGFRWARVTSGAATLQPFTSYVVGAELGAGSDPFRDASLQTWNPYIVGDVANTAIYRHPRFNAPTETRFREPSRQLNLNDSGYGTANMRARLP